VLASTPTEKNALMTSNIKYIGMDVHKESISVAVRNAAGKIVMECVMTAQSHTEFVEAFYRISQSQLSSHCVGSYSLREAYILSDQMLGGLPPSLCVDRLGDLTSRGFLPTDCRCRRFE